jgi:hypothetical protein
MLESSLHLGNFQRIGEMQIQVLQQYRLVHSRSTDAAIADDYSVARWEHDVDQGDVRLIVKFVGWQAIRDASIISQRFKASMIAKIGRLRAQGRSWRENRVCPAGNGKRNPNLPRVPADAAGRELQP